MGKLRLLQRLFRRSRQQHFVSFGSSVRAEDVRREIGASITEDMMLPDLGRPTAHLTRVLEESPTCDIASVRTTLLETPLHRGETLIDLELAARRDPNATELMVATQKRW